MNLPLMPIFLKKINYTLNIYKKYIFLFYLFGESFSENLL